MHTSKYKKYIHILVLLLYSSAVQGHLRSPILRSFKVTDFGTNQMLIYDFLLVNNTYLPPILHGFRDIAVDMSKIAIFPYPSCI